MKIEDYLDPYNRRARLYPAFLAVLPPIAVIAIRTPWFQVDITELLWLIPLSAIVVLFSDIARHLGKKAEARFIKEWNGLPSVAMLRRNDTRIDSVTKTRYLQEAQALIPQLSLPSPALEKRNPKAADAVYESISNWLRAQTRDKNQFALLFEENMHYGFHRNLYGLKIPAIIILIGSIIYILVTKQGSLFDVESLSSIEAAFLFCALIGLFVWIFGVTKKSVEGAAHAYARQLLMCLDILFRPQAGANKTTSSASTP